MELSFVSGGVKYLMYLQLLYIMPQLFYYELISSLNNKSYRTKSQYKLNQLKIIIIDIKEDLVGMQEIYGG
jgi:hypothetical protein